MLISLKTGLCKKGWRRFILLHFSFMTTWQKLITEELALNKESWDDVESIAPKDSKWLNYLFDDSYGKIQGESFTVWTKTRVYFPVCYDGSEWIGSVSRNPDNNPTQHMGG